MGKELKELLKKLFMKEPFPGGTRSKREERLIDIQVTMALTLYAWLVYEVLTNAKFWAYVDDCLDSTGLAIPGIRMLIGFILLIPIPCAAIAYIHKRIREKG